MQYEESYRTSRSPLSTNPLRTRLWTSVATWQVRWNSHRGQVRMFVRIIRNIVSLYLGKPGLFGFPNKPFNTHTTGAVQEKSGRMGSLSIHVDKHRIFKYYAATTIKTKYRPKGTYSKISTSALKLQSTLHSQKYLTDRATIVKYLCGWWTIREPCLTWSSAVSKTTK